jgi:Uma2 family endonuclease
MAMPAQPTEWTVEMVRALPDDGNRYEVIDGELFVTPAPSRVHQRAVRELVSTARTDRSRKRDLYLEKGVPEYWIVDTDARAIERWRAADRRPSILADALEWQPDPASPALVIDLPRYFAICVI